MLFDIFIRRILSSYIEGLGGSIALHRMCTSDSLFSMSTMSTKQSMAWSPLSLISAPAVSTLQGSGRSGRMQRLILGLAGAHGCNAAGVAQSSHLMRGAATEGVGLGEGSYPWLVLALSAVSCWKRSTSWRLERFFPNDRITPSMPEKASKKRRSECNFSKDSYQVMAHLVVSWPCWKFFFQWYEVRHFSNFNFTHQLRCVTGRLALRETIEVGLLGHFYQCTLHLSKGIKQI